MKKLFAAIAVLIILTVGVGLCGDAVLSREENAELREIISLLSKEIAVPKQKLVSINLVDAGLANVIAMLAEKYDINICGGKNITGSITARMKDIPLENLLRILLENNGYGLIKTGDAYYKVVTKETADEHELKELVKGLEFKSFHIKYANLNAINTLISSMEILDANSKVVLYEETSQMIIRGTEKQLNSIEKLLEEIDVQPPQILIRARIVEINKNALDSIGIEWTADFLAGDLQIKDVRGDTPPPTLSESSTFSFGLTHPKFNIDATIEALVYRKLARVLTAPRLTTSNNVEATMTIADQVPVITRDRVVSPEGTITETESVTFTSAGLMLKILPKKVGTDQILLKITPTITQISDWTDTDPPQPIVDTRETKTQVIIRHDQWLVIGGLITTSTTQMRRKIPLLGDIPLLGIAFSSKGGSKEKGDLLILVNARILSDELIGTDTKDSLEKQEVIETGKKRKRYKIFR